MTHTKAFLRRFAVIQAPAFCVLLAMGGWCPSAAMAQTQQAAPPAAASVPASAAKSANDGGKAFDVIDAAPVDLGEPDSPRASLAHYFDAVRQGRWDDATRYLVLPDALKDRGAQLARRLKAVIDDTGWIDLETVSDSHVGRTDDGLPPSLEEIAHVTLNGRTESLRMSRRNDDQGAYWAFSASTVKRIDAWYETLPDRWLRDVFIRTGLDFMLLPGPLELLWWQWFAMASLLLVSWIGGSLLGRVLRWALHQITIRTPYPWDDKLVTRLGGPLTLACSLGLLMAGSQYLMLLTPAYRLIDGLTTAGIVFATFWALWRGTGVAARQMLERPWARDSASTRTLVSVGGHLVRGAILFAGVLAMLSALGYPISTLLAGLGIGGLALAFGAQKTIENLFGSVAIAVDQPFRVGDFVGIDGVTGVVERVGLRSTRVRTLDRTLVSIPNGKVADLRTESYAARDRFRLTTTIGLTYGATRAQMEQVLAGVERVLREHPHIWPDAVVVKFSAFGASSLDIEVMAWFAVPTWADFQLCRQEALLAIMQVVQDAGADFAFPTRTVHVVGGNAG
jgi:MscS family membrane protein